MWMYLLLILSLLLVFHICVRYSESGRIVNRIPGPLALPIFGNLLNFNLSAEEIWNKILYYYDKYYPIYRVWGFMSHAVFLRHPDDLKILLSCKNNINKSETSYSNLNFCGNDGIIASGGEKWHSRRKLMNPAFNQNLLKVYLEIMNEHIVKLVQKLRSGDKETVVELQPMILKFTLAAVCESIMGIDLNKFDAKKEQDYRVSFDRISGIALYRASRPYIQDWMMGFLSVGRELDRAVKIAKDFSEQIIRERRKYHESIGYESFKELADETDVTSSKANRKRLALLDLLLAAELDGSINEEGIREEVDTFVAAGYETVGATICFTLMLLAENKEAQERARAEVNKIFDESRGDSTAMADIHKFDYLTRCVKESLRLYPTGPMIGRMITDELPLKSYTLPKSTEVFVHFLALHRDPNFWPDPMKFDPDRFLPENMQNRHPFAYLPFSAGPRNCIGQKLGVMEVTATLAHLLRNFHVEAVDSTADLRFTLHITLKSSRNTRVKLVRIDKQGS